MKLIDKPASYRTIVLFNIIRFNLQNYINGSMFTNTKVVNIHEKRCILSVERRRSISSKRSSI